MAAKADNNDIVKALVDDPSNPPNALLLTGYLGDSSEPGHRRLYFNAELSSYVEIPEDAILHTVEMGESAGPLGGQYVWIDRDAEVIHGPVQQQRQRSRFLEGQITRQYAAAAQAPAPMPPEGPIGPGGPGDLWPPSRIVSCGQPTCLGRTCITCIQPTCGGTCLGPTCGGTCQQPTCVRTCIGLTCGFTCQRTCQTCWQPTCQRPTCNTCAITRCGTCVRTCDTCALVTCNQTCQAACTHVTCLDRTCHTCDPRCLISQDCLDTVVGPRCQELTQAGPQCVEPTQFEPQCAQPSVQGECITMTPGCPSVNSPCISSPGPICR